MNAATMIYLAILFFLVGFAFSAVTILIYITKTRTDSRKPPGEPIDTYKPDIKTDFELPPESVDGHSALSEFNKLPPVK